MRTKVMRTKVITKGGINPTTTQLSYGILYNQ